MRHHSSKPCSPTPCAAVAAPLAPGDSAPPQPTSCFPALHAPDRVRALPGSRADFCRLLGLTVDGDIGGTLLAGIDDRTLQPLALLMPHLLCGEESATIAFSRFRDDATDGEHGGHGSNDFGTDLGRNFTRDFTRDGEAAARASRVWSAIAADECFHEYMLTHLVQALAADTLPSAAHNRRAASLFFLRLKSRDALTHFARICALDCFVSRILAALQQRHSRLHRHLPLMAMLSKIRIDESRHVSLTRRYLIEQQLPANRLQSERRWVAERFQAFLSPYLGAYEELGVDPDALLKCLH